MCRFEARVDLDVIDAIPVEEQIDPSLLVACEEYGRQRHLLSGLTFSEQDRFRCTEVCLPDMLVRRQGP